MGANSDGEGGSPCLFVFVALGCSGSYPDRGSAHHDSHQNALPTYLLRAPIARLRAPPTYLFPGRAAKQKNIREPSVNRLPA